MTNIVSISERKSLGLINAFELSNWFFNELDVEMGSAFVAQYAENKRKRYSLGISVSISINDNLYDNDNLLYDNDALSLDSSIEDAVEELFRCEYTINHDDDDNNDNDNHNSINDSVEFLYSALSDSDDGNSDVDNIIINKIYEMFYKDRILFYKLEKFWNNLTEELRKIIFSTFLNNFEFTKHKKNRPVAFLCGLVDTSSDDWVDSEANEHIFKEIENQLTVIDDAIILSSMYVDYADCVYKMRNYGDFYLNRAINFYQKSIENSQGQKNLYEKMLYNRVREHNNLPEEYRCDDWEPMIFNHQDLELPTHFGFVRMAIIYEKLGHFSKSLDFSIRAKNEGWSDTTDNWDKRINKLRKKINSG